jgi:hypothetical protein
MSSRDEVAETDSRSLVGLGSLECTETNGVSGFLESSLTPNDVKVTHVPSDTLLPSDTDMRAEGQYLRESSATASTCSSVGDRDIDTEDDESTVNDCSEAGAPIPYSHLECVPQGLQAFAKEVAQTVMHDIRILVKAEDYIRSYTGDSSSSPTSGISELQTAPLLSTSASNISKRSIGDHSPNEDQGDDDNSRKQPRKLTGPSLDRTQSRFACPFFKRNPEVNRKWRSCAGPGWATVHRVKCVFRLLPEVPLS